MDDNLNIVQNGEIAETPTDSQSGMITAGDETTVNQPGAGIQHPDEASWNSLSGPSQQRFKQMARNANYWREQADKVAQQPVIATPVMNANNQTMTAAEAEA